MKDDYCEMVLDMHDLSGFVLEGLHAKFMGLKMCLENTQPF